MKMSKVLRCFAAIIMLLALLCACAMASEIGELVTPTPVPVQQVDDNEIGEQGATTATHEAIEDDSALPPVPAGLSFTLEACVFDAENQWLYSTGDTASCRNLPEGCKVGYIGYIYNDNAEDVTISLGDSYDGQNYDHGKQTIRAGSYLRLRRWYDGEVDATFSAAMLVNGKAVIEKNITFSTAGAPEGFKCVAGVCEIAEGKVIAELGDSAKWSALDIGSSLGYYLTVWNEGAEDITVTIVEYEDGEAYTFETLTIAPGKAYRLPNAVQPSFTGEKQLYWVVNGEKILDTTLTYEQ